MIRAMRHVAAKLTATRFALSARRDLLLEMLALHHRIAILARSQWKHRHRFAHSVAVIMATRSYRENRKMYWDRTREEFLDRPPSA
jgi:hypothetical protein